MKKIGIATLHYGYNEGAILQAYCLSRYLSSLTGLQTEILDHRYPGKVKLYGPPADQRKRALLDSVENWLPISDRRFDCDDLAESQEYANSTYSTFVVGSDQVWSLDFSKSLFGRWRQRNPFFPRFPNLYWPGDHWCKNRVAFAPSVGQFNWLSLPRRILRDMGRRLDLFSLISFRDNHTYSFLEAVSSDIAGRAVKVPDPTFFHSVLDAKVKRDCELMLDERGVDLSRPKVGVIAGKSKLVSEIAVILQKRGLQVIAVSYPQEDINLGLDREWICPLKWANLLGLFDVIVTDRMHASIYAILNETPVFAIDTNLRVPGETTKIEDLFLDFDRVDFCKPMKALNASLVVNEVEQLLAEPWDWSAIDSIAVQRRREALPFNEGLLSISQGNNHISG